MHDAVQLDVDIGRKEFIASKAITIGNVAGPASAEPVAAASSRTFSADTR